MARYYPGDEYVDWVGLTMLNYGPLNENGEVYTFSEIYELFKNKLYWFTRKPVMLAEFGALKLGGNKQEKWLANAVDSINAKYDEISALVFFNSALDENIPPNKWYSENQLDWKINKWDFLKSDFRNKQPETLITLKENSADLKRNPVTQYDIHGVRYKKGTNWLNNYYALTREVLSNDFKLLKETGINTIQITGGNIYDHNLLLYSDQFDLNLIYQFYVDNTIDFIQDNQKLKELENDILARVEDMKENENVISYSFNYNLENHYIKPLLFDQRTAYLKWLQTITRKIKEIDPEKSLVVDLTLGPETGAKINRLHKYLPVDSFGLIVKDTTYLDEVLLTAKEQNQSVFISSLDSELFVKDPEKFRDLDIVLENFQDERKSNWLSFDGLVDFRGRKKLILENVADVWTNKEKPLKDSTQRRILKPAEALYPGQIYTYHAAVFNGREWNVAPKNDREFSYEWNLVKNDKFGNPLAIKKLGTKAEVDLPIPEDYKHYEIMLVTRKKGQDYILSTKTSLHTPAKTR